MLSTIERRQVIAEMAQESGKVMVDDLAKHFDVSTVTIRNDLNDLNSSGLLVRCRGGALASSRLSFAKELSLTEKYKHGLPVKRRLGVEVAKLIDPNSSIILDSGTTTEEVAHCLANHKGLVVMTNGLNIVTVLSGVDDDIEVIVTGGNLRKKSMSFYGRQVEESLRHMHFDKVVLGADGCDIKAGVTTYFEHEASLNRLMCEIANEVIVVTDSSKFGRRGSHIVRRFSEINTLVTDSGIPEHYVDELTQAGVNICIVDL